MVQPTLSIAEHNITRTSEVLLLCRAVHLVAHSQPSLPSILSELKSVQTSRLWTHHTKNTNVIETITTATTNLNIR